MPIYFESSRALLLERIRRKVHCGEVTERGLARLTGTSQPHVHNMLKGVRALSPEFGDRVLHHFGINLENLVDEGLDGPPAENLLSCRSVPVLRGSTGPGNFPLRHESHESAHPFPRRQVAGMTASVALRLHEDPAMFPSFAGGDLVLLDRCERRRLSPVAGAAYVIENAGGTFVRYLRRADRSLYLATAASESDPALWDYLSLAGRNILEIVRGRIVWIGRNVETLAHEPARETR